MIQSPGQSPILDTNILVDYLRQRSAAIAFIEGLDGSPVLPAMVVAELYAGVREGGERQRLAALVAVCRVIDVDAQLAEETGLLLRRYRPSHGLDIVDATIAATSLSHRLRLATRNRRHFPMLEDLLVPY